MFGLITRFSRRGAVSPLDRKSSIGTSGRVGRQGSTSIDCPPDNGAPVSEAPISVSKPKLAKSTVSTVSTSSRCVGNAKRLT